MIEIFADNSSLERSAMGSITGPIFLRGPSGAFPDEQWTDFSVVILGWWIEGLRLIVNNQRHSFLGMFMDGPYAFRVRSEDGRKGQIAWGMGGMEMAIGTVNVPDLLRSAIEGAQLLFQVFSDRYEKASLIITSNLPFAQWTSIFGEAALTAALLDRLTHHCSIHEFDWESIRFRR